MLAEAKHSVYTSAHPDLSFLVEVGQERNGRYAKLPHKLPEITLGVGHGRLSCNERLWNRVSLWRNWGHVARQICKSVHQRFNKQNANFPPVNVTLEYY